MTLTTLTALTALTALTTLMKPMRRYRIEEGTAEATGHWIGVEMGQKEREKEREKEKEYLMKRPQQVTNGQLATRLLSLIYQTSVLFRY